MDELIFKQVLLAEYDKHHVGPPGGARKLIEEAPAVDAVPVVHGRWDRSGYCSECDFWTCYCSDYHYCPNCGAKMDGE